MGDADGSIVCDTMANLDELQRRARQRPGPTLEARATDIEASGVQGWFGCDHGMA